MQARRPNNYSLCNQILCGHSKGGAQPLPPIQHWIVYQLTLFTRGELLLLLLWCKVSWIGTENKVPAILAHYYSFNLILFGKGWHTQILSPAHSTLFYHLAVRIYGTFLIYRHVASTGGHGPVEDTGGTRWSTECKIQDTEIEMGLFTYSSTHSLQQLGLNSARFVT